MNKEDRTQTGAKTINANVRTVAGDGHCLIRSGELPGVTTEEIMQTRKDIVKQIENNLSKKIYGTTNKTYYETIIEQEDIENDEHASTAIAQYLNKIRDTPAHLGYVELDAYATIRKMNIKIYTQGEHVNIFNPKSQVIVTTEAPTENNTKYLLWSGINNIATGHYDELIKVTEINEEEENGVKNPKNNDNKRKCTMITQELNNRIQCDKPSQPNSDIVKTLKKEKEGEHTRRSLNNKNQKIPGNGKYGEENHDNDLPTTLQKRKKAKDQRGLKNFRRRHTETDQREEKKPRKEKGNKCTIKTNQNDKSKEMNEEKKSSINAAQNEANKSEKKRKRPSKVKRERTKKFG
jgi:hypothetical protein